MKTDTPSTVTGKEPCPICKLNGGDYKNDNKITYSDGHAFCFACGTYFPPDGTAITPQHTQIQAEQHDPDIGNYKPLPKRRLNLDTIRLFDYRTGTYHSQPVQIARYKNAAGQYTASHYRTKDKRFYWEGDTNNLQLFGQHLWRKGGKRLIITEGEIDAMTVSQIQGNKWPVVSIPSGAQNALKAIQNNLEFVESYETIIIAFDMDEPGRKAAKQVCQILTPGKATIVNLPTPYKDPSDILQAGKTEILITALWNAQPYRPDGIINASSLKNQIHDQPKQGYQINIPKLNAATMGIHKGQLTLFTAGSGIGKSTIIHEIAYQLLTKHNATIGILALEENPKRVLDRYIGIHLNKPIHLTHSGTTEQEIENAFQATAGTNRLWIYDHFGSLEIDNLMSKIRYMAVSLKLDFILIDHISIAISGLDEMLNGDERKPIDILMTKLRSLVEETAVGIIAVAHLKTPPQGKSYSKGLEVDLNALRGSGTLSHIPDLVIALERDQQGDNPNQAKIRILKNRHTGTCGLMDTMQYNPDTGRLLPTEEPNPFDTQPEPTPDTTEQDF